MKKILYIVAALAFVTACKPKVDEFKASKGNADFDVYVAVGNSLTAGYSNGALYRSGQENSYPSILAKQFEKVGGGSFTQPILEDEDGVGIVSTGLLTAPVFVQKRTLGYATDCKSVTALGPLPPVFRSSAVLAPITQARYNNLGVPGIKSIHLMSTAYTANPFYGRFAYAPGTSYVLKDAMDQNPSFFTLWIGSNDVLLYAVGGGEQAKNTTASDTLTPPAMFTAALTNAVNTLTSNGAKGAIANIPDITTIPYFTTVPYNGLTLSAAQAGGLTALHAAAGVTFTEGVNAFLIADASATGGKRKIKSTEYLLLSVPQDSIKCFGYGSQTPIPARYVLDEAEIAKVVSYTNQYNMTIESLASSKGLAFVNTNTLLASLQSGFSFDGIDFTNKYVTGGAFSLDGIHLTPRGYAVTANHFLKAINFQYKASIPLVNVSDYAGLTFP
jgi:hypothetical protein